MNKTAIFATIAFTTGLFFLGISPSYAAPASYEPGLIIYDSDFTDWQLYNEAWIQSFLDAKPGILKNYKVGEKTAAAIIAEAASQYHVSPKVILVTLQKEQSLITNPSPTPKALDCAMGYEWGNGCNWMFANKPALRGFANQVMAGAWQLRCYTNHQEFDGQCSASYIYGAGGTYTIDGLIVTIVNSSTGALYNYTPHISGNKSFWNYWKQYSFDFNRIYPDGSLLRAAGAPHVYLVENGVLRRFATSGAFLSRYSFNRVVTVPADHLSLYGQGREIKYANYSLLKTPRGGIYLLADDVKRPIAGMKVFKAAGWSKEEVVKASWEDINSYPDGEPVTMENIFPSGQLLRNKKTGSMWYVKDGTRYGIFNKEILKSQFGNRKLIPTLPEEIEKYPKGPMIGFKDGELVTSKKNGGTAYFISNGQRMPIASAAAFQAYRFDWSNLLRVDDRAIDLHPIGPVLDVDSLVKTAGQ